MLIAFGATQVLCTASVEEKVPPHKRGSGEGWVTAEYGMLPRATHTRSDREAARGKQSGRTQEIQRLIGRSLRAVFDLAALGERTITLDCDVLQADGGTRTAAITGAFVAAHDAVAWLLAQGRITVSPIRDHVAAISVGLLQELPLLDLEYSEDSACDTDMNVVMTGAGAYVEVQGTAEGAAFTRAQMDALLMLAERGIAELDQGAKAGVGVMRLVLASNNAKKLAELQTLFAGLPLELVTQGSLGIEEADEPHHTFVENALAKARHAARASGLPAIADDSGLCVAALGGAPGVQSAHYAGELGAAGDRETRRRAQDAANNIRLLECMSGRTDRRARFVSTLVALRHADDPEPLIAFGRWEAKLLTAARGQGGFGYDPLGLDRGARRQRCRAQRRAEECSEPPRPGRGADARTDARGLGDCLMW